MKIATAKAVIAAAAILLAAGSLTACTNGSGGSGSSPSANVSSAKTAKIGLLLPDSVTPRYAADDHPMFQAKLKSLCPKCTLLYADADGDAAKQQQQADSMLTEGAKVLVVDAEDGEAAASIVADAKKQNVPVIAYDRLIDSPDLSYYISFVNQKVGKLQATALIARMKQLGIPAGSGIIQINGSPTDNNATQFAQGANSVFNSSANPYKILASYQTPNWDGTLAQNWAASQITQFGSKIKGIYAANDTTGQGALAALKPANFTPIPPITGQDATLVGIQDILTGLQYMTIYKPIKPEASQAAVLAFDLAQGKHPKAPTTQKTPGTAGPSATIPSFLLQPEAVTAKNIQSTVMKDGFYTYAQVCTPQFVSACKKYGVTK